MSITAKELAEKLNLSQTAVSMALNNKPGVSTETRRMVVEAAEKYGYDFTRLSLKKNKAGSIYAVSYRSHNAIMSYSPIFDAAWIPAVRLPSPQLFRATGGILSCCP